MSGTGVVGFGGVYGVSGEGSTTDAVGVYGEGGGASGAAGVEGTVGSADLSDASGVYGQATSGTGLTQLGVAGRISPAGAGYAVYGDNNSNAAGAWAGYFHGNVQVTGTPYCSGCTAFTNNSDLRLKKNVTPMTGALDTLLKLKGVTFEWRAPEEHGNHTGPQRGFIAQDVEQVIPEWVGVDSKGFRTLNLTGIEPMLVESIRTLKTQNDALRDRISALEARKYASATGVGPNGLAGLGGLVALGGAFFVSRRKQRAD